MKRGIRWAVVGLLALQSTQARTADLSWNPRQRFLQSLGADTANILKTQDIATGRFGNPPWCCTDQNVIFPLAAAWSIDDSANPWHGDPKLLEAIMAGGDALIAAQDKNGMWTFRKKDNSTWGQILMPWTYSRWIRAFQLIGNAMPQERRLRWQKGLTLGFDGLNRSVSSGKVHNILAHNAMALYCAGGCLAREDWKATARTAMARVVAAQDPGGWWSEHSGPVVAYNFVYVEALGLYYAMSRDAGVLDALRRAGAFHSIFIYPNGTVVETIDERNPYEAATSHGDVGFNFTPVEGNVGFSFAPEGRAFLQHQYSRRKWAVTADAAASHLLYGQSGPCAGSGSSGNALSVLGKNEALVLRRGPWFICMSAFTCEQPANRWHQDRQNFASVFHEAAGLIIGGGNTKLQPFWSNFTCGDTSGLKHAPGEENPDFRPKGGLIHIPSAAALNPDRDQPGVELTYGDARCRLIVRPIDEKRLALVHEVTGDLGGPLEGHVVFLPRLNAVLNTAAGKSARLKDGTIDWKSTDIGPWLTYDGIRVSIPAGATLSWPKKRHNPYKKDGSSTLAEARLVLCLPFSPKTPKHEVLIEVPGDTNAP